MLVRGPRPLLPSARLAGRNRSQQSGVGVVERLLPTQELAELLGFQPSTIQDWAEKGELPSFRAGGRLRFRESEVLDWLEQRRKNGPGAGGEVSPTPTADPTRAVALQVSPTASRGGEDAG
jgi:excisionase family DNA binding protein